MTSSILSIAASVMSLFTVSGAAAGPWDFSGAHAGRLSAIESKLDCGAALIGADLVLTAAHCVIDPGTGEVIAPSDLKFSLKIGEEPTTMHSVTDIGLNPAYEREDVPTRFQIAQDIALLRISVLVQGGGDDISAADEGQAYLALMPVDRDAAATGEPCPARYEKNGIIVLDCERGAGSSGSPVYGLVDGERKIVGVVSAAGVRDEAPVTFAASPTTQIDKIVWIGRSKGFPTSY